SRNHLQISILSRHTREDTMPRAWKYSPVADDLSPDFCAALRDTFERAGYHADGVLRLLGESAHAALGRGEPEPARRASRDSGPLGTLVRLFLTGDELPEREVRAALPWPESVATGLVRTDGDR